MHNPRNENPLNELINKYDVLVNKTYLNCIYNLDFCASHAIEGEIQLLKIESLGDPISPIFFTFVLNAVGYLKGVFGYILESSHHTLTLYVGLKTAKSICQAADILKNGLKSSYPNSTFRVLSERESALVLLDLFNPNCYHALTSAIVIPNNRSSDSTPINQKLTDLMGKEDFVAFFLASPMIRCEVESLKGELKRLYAALSSFSQTDYNFSHSVSKNTATHITKGITENSSNSCTYTNSKEHDYAVSQYTLIAPSASIPLEEARVFNFSIGINETSGTINIDYQAVAKGETKGCSDSKTNLDISSTTITNSDSLGFTSQNKLALDLLEKLDSLISRLTLASNDPLFCFGAYFLSSCSATSTRAAFTYSGLAKDGLLNIEDTFITTWEDCDSIFPKLIEELKKFNHLTFVRTQKNECVTTSTPITSSELLNSFYFPYKM
ncbi:MAG: hypothetical protein K0S71_24 [Clostridia bacterium]|jgi:hypothetical protein|nr:hypothetical protein [Clostridia bacterium]